MDAYARPGEHKVGERRPRIDHLPANEVRSTRRERELKKQQIAAERRAIKKSARRHLQRQLQRDLDDATGE
ncbi:MAG TPA: hypothetical protein VGH08_00390 [Chthoniobacterales bacterium]|jgi:hypothetical protein